MSVYNSSVFEGMVQWYILYIYFFHFFFMPMQKHSDFGIPKKLSYSHPSCIALLILSGIQENKTQFLQILFLIFSIFPFETTPYHFLQ